MPLELVVKGPTFYSERDEAAFFEWLQSVSCVKSVRGHLRDLHVRFKRRPSGANVAELAALFRRYRMSRASLAEFVRK